MNNQLTNNESFTPINTPMEFKMNPSSDENKTPEDGVLTRLPLNAIVEFSLGNSRKSRNPAKFKELVDSIRPPRGVFQPIVVRPHPEKQGVYERIAGNGRYEASVLLDLPDIPVMIKVLTDKEALEIQIIENSNREDLSLVDEARVAQRWIAFYEGDRKSAAQRLGWTLKKLNERLELLRCHANILDALEKGTIKPAHAMILASFDEARQIGTLETIISEKWTVQVLLERAGKAQQYLAKAKFDILECHGCPSNTEAQAGLFDTDKHAKCSNLSCFSDKTKAFVVDAKVKAEEQFGKVLLWADVNRNDRNTVSGEIVGEEQFTNGCTGCESRVVLLDDRANQEGNLIKSQCIDKSCFKKVVDTLSGVDTVEKSVNNQDRAVTLKTESTTNTPVKASTPSPKQKTNKQIIEQSRKQLRSLSADTILKHENFQRGLTLALLCQQSKYKPEINNWPTNFGSFDLNKNIINCLSVDASIIDKEITKATEYLATKSADDGGNKDFTTLMIGCFAKTPSFKEKAIADWVPTTENLSFYTKEQLVLLCADSGFTDAYGDSEPKVTFSRLSGGSKVDFIKGILEHKYDWSAFAPEKGYLDQIK
jgi:ParB family chromosome partitioning protein